MYSIKKFLLISLVLSIILVAMTSVIASYYLDMRSSKHLLDRQLENTTQCFYTFLASDIVHNANNSSLPKIQHLLNNEITNIDNTELQLKFQFVNKSGKILLHSMNAPKELLSNLNHGFSDKIIDGYLWHIYTLNKNNYKYALMMAQRDDTYNLFLKDLVHSDILTFIMSYLCFVIIVLCVINQGFVGIKKISQNLSSRSATDFSAIDDKKIPVEIQPIINELNRLFDRLQIEFEKNKQFAADAAHELRTPLAALKTQAQVAMITTSDVMRINILRNVVEGVDRATHVVQQLLILSRLTEGVEIKLEPVDLIKITTEILAQLTPSALDKFIEIELLNKNAHAKIIGNEIALSILVRNLVDNAIRYTPEHGFVKVSITVTTDRVILSVVDNGPGIAPELRQKVFERFFRILGSKASGSGLGLPIIKQIAEIHGAVVSLLTPKSGDGLEAVVVFPSANS